MKRPVILVLGPHREAVSGVSMHLNLLFASRLAEEFSLVHFQVGSEGRIEGRIGRMVRFLVSPVSLAMAILARGAAIVHFNTSLNFRAYWRDLAYIIVAKACGARVLYQVHGGALPQQFFRGNRVLTAFLRATLQLADAVVVLAQAELEAYRRFVPGQQVLTVPNAIDCGPYARVSRSRSDPAQPLKLAYVGRLIRSKGLYEVVQAMSIVRAHGIKARLVIAGSGPEESALPAYADKLGVASDVRFTGPIFGERKIGMLAESDAFVLATYREGLPYALLEAMAAGLPVITTRIGAIPDVVADGVHGLFVPDHDPEAIYRAIAELSANRDLLARMSAACRARVAAAYSMERLSDELYRLYSEMSAAKPIKELTGSAPAASRRPPCAE